MRNVPNLLSGFRIAAVPALLLLAWSGAAQGFLTLFAISLLTDFADGYIARRFDLTSELGAKLDSWGDLTTYATVPFCTWWLWPEIILAELPFVLAALSCYVAPILLALVRYGRLTSYHTWIAKLTAILMAPGLLLLFGLTFPWFFRIATVTMVLGAVEQAVITATLRDWHADVPSFLHAERIARTEHPS